METRSAVVRPVRRVRGPRHEPHGFTLFLLFFGSLLLSGSIGVWLWNGNPSVKDGRAFGTANQVGGLVGGPPSGSAPSQNPGAGSGADPALVSRGQQLANQLGCIACHTTTGQQAVGPTWKGLADSQRQLANGQTVTADDAYLKESILDPDARVARGFPPGLMTSAVAAVRGQLEQGNNVDALIAYIRSLK